jgi:hypothetical protein
MRSSSHSVRVFRRQKQIEAKSAHGASAIECCYAAAERRELSTVTNLAKSKNLNYSRNVIQISIKGGELGEGSHRDATFRQHSASKEFLTQFLEVTKITC